MISLLLLTSAMLFAQKPEKPQPEPAAKTWLVRHVAVYADAVGLLQMQFSDYGQYEGGARISLKNRYFPVVELGYGKADSEDPASRLHYKAGAPYGKVGMDFNVMKNKNDIYRLYVGFRYGYTSFKYSVEHPGLIDPVWGTGAPFSATDVDNNFHWLEGVFGVDAKIWGPFRLGWTARYKRRVASTDNHVGNPWYVPGFGRYSGSPIGGTFNVTIEL